MPQRLEAGIRIFDRRAGVFVTEQVAGESLMRLSYENAVGRMINSKILSRPWISKLVGTLQDSGPSRTRIDSFIRDFKIPMNEFEPGPFANFNEFFIRQFKPGMRSWPTSPQTLGAPAEGRYLAWRSFSSAPSFPVKGSQITPEQLLGSAEKAAPYRDGPVVIARLCPVDYHRFHFPDSGTKGDRWKLGTELHSVNPIALKRDPEIFFKNERVITELHTQNFGRLAYIEVGATLVGKIVESHSGQTFNRGEEKGYFLFGGSTVVLCGEPGSFVPDTDLLERTSQGTETLLRLGEPFARKS